MPSIITRGGMSAKALGFTGVTGPAPVYVEDVFSTYLYTGTGSSQTITNGIDLSTKGGLVWNKCRDTGYGHQLTDSERGVNKTLFTNNTNAQATTPSGSGITSFNNNGFTFGNVYWNGMNESGLSSATWTFRKQAKFFDIVTYTGNGSGARTIPHNLGCVPGMIIIRNYGSSDPWTVYHKSLGASNYVRLNETSASQSSSSAFNNTSPTDTSFTVGNWFNDTYAGGNYIAYLFADSNSGGFGAAGADSVVACGSLTGPTGSVNLGWEAQWVMIKRSDDTSAWWMFDNMRGAAETSDQYLAANTSAAEGTDNPAWITMNSTGFKFTNIPAGNWIYLAIRRGPMKTPTDATKVFSPQKYTEILTNPTTLTTGWPTDLNLAARNASGATGFYWSDRLRGSTASNNALLTSFNTSAEQTLGVSPMLFDSSTGIKVTEGFNNSAGFTDIDYQFRRAPSFFDVVCYTGTGSARTVAHNLGVAPELMIVKSRTTAGSLWIVYPLNPLKGILLNTSDAIYDTSAAWNNTAPTSSVFTVGNGIQVNTSGQNYVAYLFATCAGVSKVGSYTGTGAAQNINCGFSSSARFILIKRTDSTGDWYVYDSARGISSSNDPYLLINTTDAEVTGTNYVDAYASGFALTSSAPAALNANGGSYIFLAIA